MPSQSFAAQTQAFPTKWAEAVAELIKRQQASVETSFNAGLKVIEEAFGIAGARNPEEFRDKVIRCCRKGFEYVQQLTEAQLQAVQAALAKAAELVARPELPAAIGSPA
jgi:hypothetical protein